MCEWKDLKEITTGIELLWNFSFYDFLEKSQTKTLEERTILFLCIRFFIPAIAFDMAKRNAAQMLHSEIDYVQICENTLDWLRVNTEMPLLKRLNGFAHGQAKVIVETTVNPGKYYVYNKLGNAVNVSKSKNSPGSWINGKLNVSGIVTVTPVPMVSTPTASSGGKITIKAGTWNVRAAASLSGKIMKVIRGGVTVTYSEKSKDGWYKIDGGWVGPGAIK